MFTLPFDEPIASKRRYSRRWTILPIQLANVPCNGPSTLLAWLNAIFERDIVLTTGVRACLTEFIDDGCDLGQVYGYLRPWMSSIFTEEEFSGIPAAMRERREKDFQQRSSAINGNHIIDPHVPPRRVWDLYANRVLPYYVLRPSKSSDERRLPSNLWAVSHSWVAPSKRRSVLTTINGRAWRVPIPWGTTLGEIRDELLILGAEYVFLDVLCLRQQDELLPGFESTRRREWRLDVPTIGNVYDLHRPVIVYFNGLGLPFRDGGRNIGDQYHWFNRAWTLQESPLSLVPGGLRRRQLEFKLTPLMNLGILAPSLPSWISAEFLEHFESIRALRWKIHMNELGKCLKSVKSRFCSNPVDQVACMAYLLKCPSLPIYDADMDVEVAWSLLVECLPAETRTQLLFTSFNPSNIDLWQPTWEQVNACEVFPFVSTLNEEEQLIHLDGSSPHIGYKYGFDAYYHKALVIEGCHLTLSKLRTNLYSGAVQIPLRVGVTQDAYDTFRISAFQGRRIPQHVPYLLISVGSLDTWVVARIPSDSGSSSDVDKARKMFQDEVECGAMLIVYR